MRRIITCMLACAQHGSSRAASHEPHEPHDNNIKEPFGKISPRLHESLMVQEMNNISSYFPSLRARLGLLNSKEVDWRSTLCQDASSMPGIFFEHVQPRHSNRGDLRAHRDLQTVPRSATTLQGCFRSLRQTPADQIATVEMQSPLMSEEGTKREGSQGLQHSYDSHRDLVDLRQPCSTCARKMSSSTTVC